MCETEVRYLFDCIESEPIDAYNSWLIEGDDPWETQLEFSAIFLPTEEQQLEERLSTDNSFQANNTSAESLAKISLSGANASQRNHHISVRKPSSKKTGSCDVHKRYRQRKKQNLAELENKAQALTKAHNQLQQANIFLHERVGLLDLLVKGCNAQVQLLTNLESSSSRICDLISDGPVKQFALRAGLDRFDNLTVANMVAYWKQIIPHLSELLMEVELGYDPTVLQKLEFTCQPMMTLYSHLCAFRSDIIAQSWAFNCATGKCSEPDVSHWVNALTALKLTPDQKRKIVYSDFITRVPAQRLSEERQDIIADFSKLSLDYSPNVCTTGACGELLSAETTLKRIKSSMAKEANLQVLLTLNFCGEVSPLQFIKFLVLCYPYFPDPSGICIAIRQTWVDVQQELSSIDTALSLSSMSSK